MLSPKPGGGWTSESHFTWVHTHNYCLPVTLVAQNLIKSPIKNSLISIQGFLCQKNTDIINILRTLTLRLLMDKYIYIYFCTSSDLYLSLSQNSWTRSEQRPLFKERNFLGYKYDGLIKELSSSMNRKAQDDVETSLPVRGPLTNI